MYPLPTRKQRGSILAITVFLSILGAVSVTWMIGTLLDHQQSNQRRRELQRAYFAAESGVAQVIHWGNFPEDYDTVDDTGLFYRATSGTFPNLTTAFGSGDIAIADDDVAALTSSVGGRIAQIESITLLGPDAANDPISCLFKVVAVGVADSGVDREVIAYLKAAPLLSSSIALPAGLISLEAASQSGNGTVHWGESWSKGDFTVLNKSLCNHLDSTDGTYDQWAKVRTEGQLDFNTTWKSGDGKDIYDELDPARQFPATVGVFPLPGASGDYAVGVPGQTETFEQHLSPGTLDWPDLLNEYDAFKAHAKAHGRYYSTDAAGNIYRDGVEDGDHIVDFDVEFGDADRDSSPYDLVFIDTVDGNFPEADGSNLSTIQNSGTGAGMKGIFWVGANYTQTGSGNPADLVDAEKPDLSTETIVKCYLDGVFYSAGVVDMAGNPVVYGTVVAEGGYASGGTPEIYYNHRLATGLDFPTGNIGSVFSIVLQDNY